MISKLRKIYELKFVFEREAKMRLCLFVCGRVKGLVLVKRVVGGGEAFIVVQIGNSELFHCGIERVVFLIRQERY